MRFLLDADTFIEAKDDFYGFDFCPAYWDWLLLENSAGRVFSIERVQQELTAGNDDLVEWAKNEGANLFLPMTLEAVQAFKQVSNYVQNMPASFDSQKSRFLSGGDAILVAHAMAHGDTVVTRETLVLEATKKIKLPNICHHFNVPTLRPHEMLLQLGARFVLEVPPSP